MSGPIPKNAVKLPILPLANAKKVPRPLPNPAVNPAAKPTGRVEIANSAVIQKQGNTLYGRQIEVTPVQITETIDPIKQFYDALSSDRKYAPLVKRLFTFSAAPSHIIAALNDPTKVITELNYQCKESSGTTEPINGIRYKFKKTAQNLTVEILPS